MNKRSILAFASLVLVLFAFGAGDKDKWQSQMRGTTAAQRRMAAVRTAAARKNSPETAAILVPGGTPDYFGIYPNYANSPLPANASAVPLAVTVTGGGGTGGAGLATVTNGSVTGIGVTAPGSGYYATPDVVITGATGAGATAVANTVNGVIVGIVVTNPGTGYSAPVVTIVPHGGGTGATAQAFIDLSGAITSIAVTNGGSGYLGPIVTINPGTSGGTGAAATATVDPTLHIITGLTITSGGNGYFLQRNANGTFAGAIRKFVDKLPGAGAANANNLGQYIPVAIPDQSTYSGSDYYEISLVEYTEKLHSDLLPTTLRGYMQTNTTDATVKIPSYLGPIIVAQANRPVRVKFTNALPTGAGGNLFIPVDTTVMGAGMGPTGVNYTQNRAVIHLHGGNTPWISDGTPHQWITPATESTPYPKGVSVQDVPDMPPSPPGAATFFYTNQQTARLMFYHDHAYGITRLNVYAGEAAGYVLRDTVEQSMMTSGVLPADELPLIIQDKTFLPNATQLANEDPTWPFAVDATKSNLWFPHVYMPNQNPWDIAGVNAMGRWDYGPWFWPPFTGLINGPVPNPLAGLPGEPPNNPGTPNPSLVPEAFMDTPVVNGTAYPYLQVGKKAYRLRILNASNDRSLNLQLYYAQSNKTMWNAATGALLDPNAGEVPMVPAIPGIGLPPTWPTDGRDGGVPAPSASGPSFIQIGSEGGFLPYPAVLPNTPVGYEYNRRNIVVLNVSNQTLFLGPAERADVIVDFSGVPDGSKLILYNDAPAPVPAFDSRYDYYTGDPDQTSTGGAPSTQPGYGPNTRTIMQFQVMASLGTAAPYNLAALQTALPTAFAATQPAPIVPQAGYNAAYGANFPADAYVRIQDTSMTFTPIGAAAPISMALQPKAIQELFEANYGRMNAILGVEIPFSNLTTQTTIPYAYVDPPTELIANSNAAALIGSAADGTQIWKITHNGVDTHAIHFHLFNVQLLNRVGWDGAVVAPDANELGWKETVRMHPLQDAIVALRPIVPTLPFKIPNSIRPLDPTSPLGSTGQFTNIDPNNNPVAVTNHLVNFGWEYVWHCHLLGHEENDMMRPIIFAVAPQAPSNLTAAIVGANAHLTWTDNSLNETGFTVQKATTSAGPWTTLTNTLPIAAGTGTTVTYDNPITPGGTFFYRVQANNLVGDTTVYAAPATGYPNGSADSPFSNIAGVGPGAQPTLSVTPPEGLISSGTAGGPFSPSSKDYTLQNTGGGSLSWTALKTQNWVTLSQSSGTLNAGQSTIVTVSINGTATTLMAPSYSDTVTFTNTTNGLGNTTRPVSLSVDFRQFITVRGADNWIYSRSMNTAEALSAWTKLNGKTNVTPATAIFNGKLYMVVKSDIDTTIWWNSMTPNGVWGSWAPMDGFTSDKPSIAAFNNKLYIAVRGTDSKIYFRSMTTAEVFAPWSLVPVGLTSVPPAIHAFNNMLYLVVKDSGDNKIWWNKMNTSDVWSGWNLTDGLSPSTAAMTVFNNLLYIAVQGSDNKIYYRSMSTADVFAAWGSIPGFTDSSPALEDFNSKLYIVVKSNVDMTIWWNSMTAAGVWGSFAQMDGLSPTTASLAAPIY